MTHYVGVDDSLVVTAVCSTPENTLVEHLRSTMYECFRMNVLNFHAGRLTLRGLVCVGVYRALA